MTAIKMPQLGETVVEGTILKWLKQEGDEVSLDEPLFEISTDKVDTEVPSSAAGTLTKILVPEGQTVAVGTEVAEIGETGAGDGRGGGATEAAEEPAAAQPAAPTPASDAGADETPAAGAGISASTLSVEISNSGSSRCTLSPTFLSHLVTVPSAIDSPI